MLLRLILSLLLAAVALPGSVLAMAPCHDAPAMMAMPAHHAAPTAPTHREDAAGVHICLGCIPPASLAPRLVLHPAMLGDAPLISHVARFDTGDAPTPATPPPRRET